MDRDALQNLLLSLRDFQFGPGQLWLRLRETFLLPGDYLLASLLDLVPALAALPGLPEQRDAYTAVLSIVSWLAAILLTRAAYRAVHRARGRSRTY